MIASPVTRRPRYAPAWAVLAALGALALPRGAAALQVRFLVTDKLGQPVPGAQICLQEDASQCQQTDAQGGSLVSPTVSARRATAAPGLRMSARPGYLILEAPRAGMARIARYDASGRGLEAPRELALKAGSNRIEWPRGKAGLVFTRLEFQGVRYGFLGVADAPDEGARLGALGKAATANLHAFTIAKSGYQTFLFRPRREIDTALVRLAAIADTGVRYTGTIRARVDSIDTAGHLIKYTYAQYACDGSNLMVSQQKSTFPLWVRGSKWYFPAGACYGVALAKQGDGLFGDWKTTGLELLPEGLFPTACDPVKDSLVTAVTNLFFLDEGGGWEIDLRPDSLVIHLNRRLCFGNQLIANPAGFNGQNGHPLLVSNSCQEVTLQNARSETATYAFPVSSDSLRAVFTYKTTTCSGNGVPLAFETTAPMSCPAGQANTVLADSAWQACVRQSGFADTPQ